MIDKIWLPYINSLREKLVEKSSEEKDISFKQDAEEFAEKMSAYGYKLDFSLKSLEEDIDNMIESEDVDLSDSSEVGSINQTGLEAYIGETLTMLFRGKPKGEFKSGKLNRNFYFSYIEFGKFRYYPSDFIRLRLSNGPGEGSYKEHLEKLLPRIKG